MELAGVILGFLLGLIPGFFDRKRRIKTHLGALRGELTACLERVAVLQNDNVMAPLYRLPTFTLDSSLAVLLTEGGLSESECLVLVKYASQVRDINRGLDNADELRKNGKLDELRAEFERNKGKASSLAGDISNNVKKVLDKKMPVCWLLY